MWRLLLAGCCFSLISCATAVTGTREAIGVSSSPSGADATLICDGLTSGSGVTPTTITIQRKSGDCLLKVSKEGYVEQTVVVERGMNPVYWTNMVFAPLAPVGVFSILLGNSRERDQGVAMLVGGAAAFLTDFATGAAHAHYPHKVDVVLKPK